MNLIGLPQQPVAALGTPGVATLNADAGIITTPALSAAAGATYTLTLFNNQIQASSVVILTPPYWGTNTQGTPIITKITPGVGRVDITIQNQHAASALNGTLGLNFVVLN